MTLPSNREMISQTARRASARIAHPIARDAAAVSTTPNAASFGRSL